MKLERTPLDYIVRQVSGTPLNNQVNIRSLLGVAIRAQLDYELEHPFRDDWPTVTQQSYLEARDEYWQEQVRNKILVYKIAGDK